MKNVVISNDVKYIGADDKELDLFEGQYIVPNGMAYNSYLIKDEKNAVLDTIDRRKTDKWISNIEKELNGEDIDYLIVSHLEPDHSYNIQLLAEKYPNMKIVGNDKTFAFMPQFFDIKDLENRKVVVKEGDVLDLGSHKLHFVMAPMVHWPEVMFEYEEKEKILFSADAFGKFGALDTDEDWACEARRYYFNIVGKYGMQVQAVLKKLANIDVKTICPLHGPILNENLEYYINKYNIWSSYTPEDEGIFIACSSIHGNTLNAVNELADKLKEKGAKVVVSDLTRCDMAEAVEDAFRYSKLVVASSSYNFGLFPPMEHFLNHLKSKNYQNRKIAIIENGTWAPTAGKCMQNIISEMKDITLYDNIVTIKTKLNDDSRNSMDKLIDYMIEE